MVFSRRNEIASFQLCSENTTGGPESVPVDSESVIKGHESVTGVHERVTGIQKFKCLNHVVSQKHYFFRIPGASDGTMDTIIPTHDL